MFYKSQHSQRTITDLPIVEMQNAWKFVYTRKDSFRLTVKVMFNYAKIRRWARSLHMLLGDYYTYQNQQTTVYTVFQFIFSSKIDNQNLVF